MFAGFVATSYSMTSGGSGGGSDYLCMPPQPQWNRMDRKNDNNSYAWVRAGK